MKKSSYFYKLSYETIKLITKLQLYMKTQLGAKQAFRYAVFKCSETTWDRHTDIHMDGRVAPKYVYRKALLLSKGIVS